jgi:hypothetical protein
MQRKQLQLKRGHQSVIYPTTNKNKSTNIYQRLIPDTENYVHEIFQGLGLAEPSSTKTQTQTQTKTPTATVKAEQGQTENKLATPTTHIIYESSISYTPTYGSDGAGFTHTVKHQASINKPIENIQIGHDWEKGGKFEAKDLPLLFDALTRELEHRVGNMIDSSDEVGLDEFTDGL